MMVVSRDVIKQHRVIKTNLVSISRARRGEINDTDRLALSQTSTGIVKVNAIREVVRASYNSATIFGQGKSRVQSTIVFWVIE